MAYPVICQKSQINYKHISGIFATVFEFISYISHRLLVNQIQKLYEPFLREHRPYGINR